ncbi:down syndrome cell adhesion molecule-like protein 1 homolog [Trichonephila clavipes]|nr:down syndrome cell adhesion molecule-like protein 1 homolog [Trichonephila clavipes]
MCVIIEGDHPFDFKWFKDGHPLSSDKNHFSIESLNEFTSILTIERLNADSNGNYTCRVTNSVGSNEKSDMLMMKGLNLPIIKPFHFSGELREGIRTMVMCGIVEGDLPFEFKWFKDGNPLSPEKGHISIEPFNEFTSILTIERLNANSNGNYTCRVTNSAGSDEKSDALTMKGLKPPIVNPFHFTGELKEDLRAMVMCGIVDGDPPNDFKWFKDGDPLSPEKGHLSIQTNDLTSILIIERLNAGSNGNYTCRVTNSVGSDEKFAILVMKDGVSQPEIQPFHFLSNLSAGKRTVVVCVVLEGDPPFTFTWSKDGVELKDNEQMFTSEQNEFTSTLTINKLDATSNGNYSCKVSNVAGFDVKYDTLRVHVSPQWVQEPKDFSTMGGQTAVLDCFTRGYPKPNVVWRKRTKMAKIDKGDEGVYTCEVSNGVGESLRKSARLDVKAPPRISSAYRIKSARKAESATLVCEAEGDQPLITSWAKNGIGLQTTGRVQINEELSATGIIAQMTILSTHRNDGGSYTCSAKNRFGEVNNTIVLRIVEPPERPVSVKVGEVWSRAATVSWSAPFDGNSPITQYVVHYWKDIEGASHRLQERSVPATQTSVLLGDLQPGTTYLLRVVAENDVGRGESSEPFKLRTEEEAPSAPPTDVTVIATGPTSVSVTWKAPPREHWNGRLLGYYVGHKRHQTMEPFAYHTVPAGRSAHADYRLTRLQKATRYSVVVKAFNSVGSGQESHELLVETSDKDSLKPPHLYVSETSDTSALLEWEHPRDLPENVFTHYMVYYRPGSEGSWHSVHVPSKDKRFKLTSLESGTKYQVYLTAYSESGVSDPSDTLTLLTEGKAMAPSIVSALGDTPYFLKLHFIIPVAASIVIIVIVIVVAWVWVKKAQFRDEREAARVSLYAEAYYTLPHKGTTYFPPPGQQVVAAGAGGPAGDDAYDVPWDLPVARPKM